MLFLFSACSAPADNSSKTPDISSSNIEETEPPIIDNSGFKNINEDEPFEIHTEAQLEFLKYEGSYGE